MPSIFSLLFIMTYILFYVVLLQTLEIQLFPEKGHMSDLITEYSLKNCIGQSSTIVSLSLTKIKASFQVHIVFSLLGCLCPSWAGQSGKLRGWACERGLWRSVMTKTVDLSQPSMGQRKRQPAAAKNCWARARVIQSEANRLGRSKPSMASWGHQTEVPPHHRALLK